LAGQPARRTAVMKTGRAPPNTPVCSPTPAESVEPPQVGAMRPQQRSRRILALAAGVSLSLLPLLLLSTQKAFQPWQCGGEIDHRDSASQQPAPWAKTSAAGPPAPFLSPDDVPPGCMRLERVCVDQQMVSATAGPPCTRPAVTSAIGCEPCVTIMPQVVMMDERYGVQSTPQLPLPQWAPEAHYGFPWTSESNPDIWASRRNGRTRSFKAHKRRFLCFESSSHLKSFLPADGGAKHTASCQVQGSWRS
jgi:hypothetical protein